MKSETMLKELFFYNVLIVNALVIIHGVLEYNANKYEWTNMLCCKKSKLMGRSYMYIVAYIIDNSFGNSRIAATLELLCFGWNQMLWKLFKWKLKQISCENHRKENSNDQFYVTEKTFHFQVIDESNVSIY